MKTSIFSETQMKRYKRWGTALGIVFVGLGIYSTIWAIYKEEYMMFFNIPALIIIPVIHFNRMKRIRSISYDDEAIYYDIANGNEMHKVDFKNIRSITVGRYDGWCKINLIEANDEEKQIFFTPSAWFPFDFWKSNKKIYVFKQKIDAYMQRTGDNGTAAIPINYVATIN